jgi:hypothetical protein
MFGDRILIAPEGKRAESPLPSAPQQSLRLLNNATRTKVERQTPGPVQSSRSLEWNPVPSAKLHGIVPAVTKDQRFLRVAGRILEWALEGN